MSIVRRLHGPLTALVKIDPKSTGVDQYQHNISQSLSTKKLDTVTEDYVNTGDIDLNAVSVSLLMRIMAQNIINWRNENCCFRDVRNC